MNDSTGKLLLPLPEAARRISVGRSKLYELIGAGRLRTVTIGRRRLVPAKALEEYVELLTRESTLRTVEGASQ